jgi:hypothetical protein
MQLQHITFIYSKDCDFILKPQSTLNQLELNSTNIIC